MISKGGLFVVTYGEDSDYSVCMAMEALRDISDEELESWKHAQRPLICYCHSKIKHMARQEVEK